MDRIPNPDPDAARRRFRLASVALVGVVALLVGALAVLSYFAMHKGLPKAVAFFFGFPLIAGMIVTATAPKRTPWPVVGLFLGTGLLPLVVIAPLQSTGEFLLACAILYGVALLGSLIVVAIRRLRRQTTPWAG